MHKLLILVLPTGDPAFPDRWPQFLHAAECIPGLRREASGRVSQVLFGDLRCELVHELYFDSHTAMESGLNSPQGVRAGQVLQQITGGKVVLLLAEHREDALEHIQKFRNKPPSGEAG